MSETDLIPAWCHLKDSRSWILFFFFERRIFFSFLKLPFSPLACSQIFSDVLSSHGQCVKPHWTETLLLRSCSQGVCFIYKLNYIQKAQNILKVLFQAYSIDVGGIYPSVWAWHKNGQGVNNSHWHSPVYTKTDVW